MGFDELWNGFDAVVKKTENGEKFANDLLKYLQKRQSTEAKYVRSLGGLSNHFKTEFEVGTMQDCWETLKKETDTLAADRQNFVDATQSLVAKISDQLREDRKERALLVARGTKLVKNLSIAEDTMKRARAKYVEARKQQDKSTKDLEKAQAGGGKTSKQQKAMERDEKRADKLDNEYRITVNNLRDAQDQFHDVDMPQLLREFEQFENERSNRLRAFFQELVKNTDAMQPLAMQSTDRFKKKVAAVDTMADINLFVKTNKPDSATPPTRAQYVSYDGSVVLDASGGGGSSSAKTKDKKEKRGRTKSEKKKKDKLGKSRDTDDSSKKVVGFSSTPEKNESGISAPQLVSSSSPVAPTVTTGAATSNDGSSDNNIGGGGDTTGADTDADATATTSAGPEDKGATKEREDEVDVDGAVVENTEGGGGDGDGEGIVLTALYSYEATEENELTFEEGEKIILLEQDESGWWRGRNELGVEGVFPSNFVEGDDGQGTSSTLEINADYRVLYDYEAEDDTELTIHEGEILHVMTETDGWYYGSNSSGAEGNFPSNFLEPV